MIRNVVIQRYDYNIMAFGTDQDFCGKQGRHLGAAVIFKIDYVGVLAHELGHSWGLKDEYCSEEAGGDPRCSGPNDINFLGSDLGCNPFPDGCCDECDGYEICCDGNKAPFSDSDPCNMASADAGCDIFDWILGTCKTFRSSGREFCDRCLDQFIKPINPRSPQNPNGPLAPGNIPLQCPLLGNPVGPQPGLDITYSITKQGIPTLKSIDTFFGRPMLWAMRDHGQFKIKILKAYSLIYETAFDFIHDSIESTSPIQDYEEYSMVLRVAVPEGVDKSDTLKILVHKDDFPVGQTTANGQAPVADAGPDQVVECSGNGGA